MKIDQWRISFQSDEFHSSSGYVDETLWRNPGRNSAGPEADCKKESLFQKYCIFVSYVVNFIDDVYAESERRMSPVSNDARNGATHLDPS
jgi:hypothetical protein